jgi:hypothetical protein
LSQLKVREKTPQSPHTQFQMQPKEDLLAAQVKVVTSSDARFQQDISNPSQWHAFKNKLFFFI